MNKDFFKTDIFFYHAIGLGCMLLASVLDAFNSNWSAFASDIAALVWCFSSLIWSYSATNK